VTSACDGLDHRIGGTIGIVGRSGRIPAPSTDGRSRTVRGKIARWRKRPEVTVGAVVGAIVTLAIAGSIDRFLPLDHGGWGVAIRQAIHDSLGPAWAEVAALRLALGAVVFLTLAVVGAVVGVVFALFLSWFLSRKVPWID
jgi:hypothetical protein